MSEPSTTASTWAPDIDELSNVLWDFLDRFMEWDEAQDAIDAVIAEYQRQAAAAGLVMVAIDDLRLIQKEIVDSAYLAFVNGYRCSDEAVAAGHRVFAALVSTPEPVPGGDG